MCCMELGFLTRPCTPRGLSFMAQMAGRMRCFPPGGTVFNRFQNRRWLKPHGIQYFCCIPFYRAKNLGLLGLLALFFYLFNRQTMVRRTAL